jgi:ribosomal protein S13
MAIQVKEGMSFGQFIRSTKALVKNTNETIDFAGRSFSINANVQASLQTINGIGTKTAADIVNRSNFGKYTSWGLLDELAIVELTALVKKHTLTGEGRLRYNYITKLLEAKAGTYRFFRKENGYPCRGQRTQSNRITAKRLNSSKVIRNGPLARRGGRRNCFRFLGKSKNKNK